MARKKEAQKPVSEVMDPRGAAICSTSSSPSGIRAQGRLSRRSAAQELIRNLVDQLSDPALQRQAKGVTETIEDAHRRRSTACCRKQMDEIIHQPVVPEARGLVARSEEARARTTETGEHAQDQGASTSSEEGPAQGLQAGDGVHRERALEGRLRVRVRPVRRRSLRHARSATSSSTRGTQDVALMSQHTVAGGGRVARAVHRRAPDAEDVRHGELDRDARTRGISPRSSTRATPRTPSGCPTGTPRTRASAALVLPHVLRRLPYGQETEECENFAYEEDVEQVPRGLPLGERLLRLRGAHHGCVRQVPLVRWRSAGRRAAASSRTCRSTRSRRVRATSARRSRPRCSSRTPGRRSSPTSASSRWCSARTPTTPRSSAATRCSARRSTTARRRPANASLSSKIPYLFTSCRIAHYLKAICRDKIGSFMERKDVEDYLNRWLVQYVLNMDDASQEAKAQMPLARGPGPGHRRQGTARLLQGRRPPPTALPARGDRRGAEPGDRAPAASRKREARHRKFFFARPVNGFIGRAPGRFERYSTRHRQG